MAFPSAARAGRGLALSTRRAAPNKASVAARAGPPLPSRPTRSVRYDSDKPNKSGTGRACRMLPAASSNAS